MTKKKKGSNAKSSKANDARGYATTSSSRTKVPLAPPAMTTTATSVSVPNTLTTTSITTPTTTTIPNRSLRSSASTIHTTAMTATTATTTPSLDRFVMTPELHQASLDLLRALYEYHCQYQQQCGDPPPPQQQQHQLETFHSNDRPPLHWMERHNRHNYVMEHPNDDSTTMDPTKMRRRLGTIYDTLTVYGFQLHQIVDGLHSISSSFSSSGRNPEDGLTLTLTLDWLCYYTPPHELPVRFTEAILLDRVNDHQKRTGVSFIFASSWSSSANKDEDDKSIRMVEHPTWRVDHATENGPMLQVSVADNNMSNNVDDKWRKAHNAYLISQYQYDDDDNDDNDDDGIVNIDLPKQSMNDDHLMQKPTNSGDETMQKKESNNWSELDSCVEQSQPASSIALATNDDAHGDTSSDVVKELTSSVESSIMIPETSNNNAIVVELTDDEIRLQELKIELQTLDDSNNDANNYMRSKQEVKELKHKISKLRKQVSSWEAKISRQRTKHNQELIQMNQEDSDHGEEADMFSMFDDDKTSTNQSSQPSSSLAPQGKIEFPDDAIPPHWTGTTPKEYLEEHCRKEKYPPPKFHKLSRNGCQLSMKHCNDEIISLEEQGPHSNFIYVQNYLSIQALYQMKQTLSLHRIFPPFFRDLWLTWQNDVKERLQYQAMLLEESRQKIIDELYEMVAANERSCSLAKGTNTIGTGEQDKRPLSNQMRKPAFNGSKYPNREKGTLLKENFFRRVQSAEYQRLLSDRENLPIYSRRDEIIDTIHNNPVTILCAETGSGKTTQCSTFILENALRQGNGDTTSILCTQPRRVAAISVAERVTEEWGEASVGKLVGYQIRMEAKRNSETRILFCTTGVILRRLMEDKELSGISHVVVDEVHERQWQIDILLVALRSLVNGPRRDLKVILMSATLDKKLFGSFFVGAPIVNVPGRTFPVRTLYLENLLDLTNHVIEEGSRYARRSNTANITKSIQVRSRQGTETHEYIAGDEVSDRFPDCSIETRKSMDRVDETVLNYDLIEDILQEICFVESHSFAPLPLKDASVSLVGSVLIFLPGIGEIRTLKERLSGSKTFGDMNRFDIVPLHSSLSSSEQKRAFIPSTLKRRKIILSTNIAETSVTIPDVVYVIDSGRFREITRDRRYDSRKLVVTWCSRASAKQRAGRAGRVQPGVCLKLYSSHTESETMKSSIEPELQRIPLEEVCLSILASEFSVSCSSFLSQTPQPPSEDAVQSALHALEEIGALKTYSPSRAEPTIIQRELLTPLGRLLSKLPVDARVGKMLLLGSIFNCTDYILTIAATLSASKSPFATSFEDRQDFQAAHAQFLTPYSDFLTFVNVWNAYRQAEAVGTGRKFCLSNKLNYSTMIEIQESRCHFLDLLAGLGFVDQVKNSINEADWMSNKHNRNCECEHLIHAIVFAGMFPNVGLYRKSSTKSNCYALHKSEQLFIQSSVNAKLTVSPPSNWVVYSEKFGTERRVSISKTAFIPQISLILFGSQPQVLHAERKVCIDDWIEIATPASNAVTLREIQTRLSDFLSSFFDDSNRMNHTSGLSNNIESVVSCVGKLFRDISSIN